jgi:glycine dehydrogenase
MQQVTRPISAQHKVKVQKMNRIEFSTLEAHDGFIERHIGPSADEQQAMLATLKRKTLDALIDEVVPTRIRSRDALALPAAQNEPEVLAAIKAMAKKNKVFKSYLGMGYYGTHTPNVILRNVLENPAWYTAYTPYQPEISQGRLEALINFQTMVSDLTGLDIANASLLDEATAAAEAMTLARRFAKAESNVFFVSNRCHPQTIAVIQTRAHGFGIEVKVGDEATAANENIFGLLLQYPASTGRVIDYRNLVLNVQTKGAVVVMAADLLSLALLTSPGELGADIAIGTTQRFGVPMGFGGPHAAYLACKDAYKRQLPGRLVGVSIDNMGNPAYRLTLQTREQHIRREKATSNICTAQVLLAVMAGMYATYHGPAGLRRIATYVNRVAATFAEGLRELGFTLADESFFDTVLVDTRGETRGKTEQIMQRARAHEINLRLVDANTLAVSVDETTTKADIETLWNVFSDDKKLSFAEIEKHAKDTLPASLNRTSAYLTHPVFNRHHSETEMLRYLRSLSDKDLALDRTMIPLGSCTMKLNATAEMIPVTWPEFSNMHPFAPEDQSVGYREMIVSLEKSLCEITGYDAVSLQPNSGAQGEFAGMLAIQAYHRARGEGHRNIVLIPSSAHGTNPASAQMVGMDVVVVACDSAGNVDVADLTRLAESHSKNLAALMVTYPSTHGVFEDAIVDICDLIHKHGGQVYLDGANMNAVVGVAKPGKFGADVSHLNLHKTFCIPHGGGGPGVGPVAVRAHLAPYLPSRLGIDANSAVGPVSAAPYGSAGILAISWAYIALMGSEGLTQATKVAILNANYIATRLAPHYPILYSGHNGLIAHECILDARPLKEKSGVSAEDIAKRLIDYGFHAPTLSFPVAGTLMVEPTESESKFELDRFIDAMISIRHEIRLIEEGKLDRDDNPLKNAPHTAQVMMAESWVHDYTREMAAFPLPAIKHAKYWPPVGRVDNIYGDKNVFCSCPPLLTYQTDAVEAAE